MSFSDQEDELATTESFLPSLFDEPLPQEGETKWAPFRNVTDETLRKTLEYDHQSDLPSDEESNNFEELLFSRGSDRIEDYSDDFSEERETEDGEVLYQLPILESRIDWEPWDNDLINTSVIPDEHTCSTGLQNLSATHSSLAFTPPSLNGGPRAEITPPPSPDRIPVPEPNIGLHHRISLSGRRPHTPPQGRSTIDSFSGPKDTESSGSCEVEDSLGPKQRLLKEEPRDNTHESSRGFPYELLRKVAKVGEAVLSIFDMFTFCAKPQFDDETAFDDMEFFASKSK